MSPEAWAPGDLKKMAPSNFFLFLICIFNLVGVGKLMDCSNLCLGICLFVSIVSPIITHETLDRFLQILSWKFGRTIRMFLAWLKNLKNVKDGFFTVKLLSFMGKLGSQASTVYSRSQVVDKKKVNYRSHSVDWRR